MLTRYRSVICSRQWHSLPRRYNPRQRRKISGSLPVGSMISNPVFLGAVKSAAGQNIIFDKIIHIFVAGKLLCPLKI